MNNSNTVPEPDKEIKIASWNLKGCGPHKMKMISNTVASQIQNFDIIAIQELGVHKEKNKIDDVITPLTNLLNSNYTIKTVHAGQGYGGTEYLAIIYNTKLLNLVSFEPKIVELITEGVKERKFQLCIFEICEVKNSKFCIANVHVNTNLKNFDLTLTHFECNCGPTIIIGDFNINANQLDLSEYEGMYSILKSDSPTTIGGNYYDFAVIYPGPGQYKMSHTSKLIQIIAYSPVIVEQSFILKNSVDNSFPFAGTPPILSDHQLIHFSIFFRFVDNEYSQKWKCFECL